MYVFLSKYLLIFHFILEYFIQYFITCKAKVVNKPGTCAIPAKLKTSSSVRGVSALPDLAVVFVTCHFPSVEQTFAPRPAKALLDCFLYFKSLGVKTC